MALLLVIQSLVEPLFLSLLSMKSKGPLTFTLVTPVSTPPSCPSSRVATRGKNVLLAPPTYVSTMVSPTLLLLLPNEMSLLSLRDVCRRTLANTALFPIVGNPLTACLKVSLIRSTARRDRLTAPPPRHRKSRNTTYSTYPHRSPPAPQRQKVPFPLLFL